MRSSLVVHALLMFIVAIGCGGNSSAVSVQSIGWNISENGEVAAKGIDDAQVMIGRLENSPAIVLWSDCRGSSGAGTSIANGVNFSAILQTHDGREVKAESMVVSGKAGDVSIDGQLFASAKGRFFLISTADGKTRVKQLDRTLPDSLLSTKLEDRSSAFREFAKADAELMAFYSSGDSETPMEPTRQPSTPEAR